MLIKMCVHDVSSRIYIGTYLSHAFLIHSVLKQGDGGEHGGCEK